MSVMTGRQSCRYCMDVLRKSTSSAYSVSVGLENLMSSAGLAGSFSRTLLRAASRYTVKRTGDRESRCGVPMLVLNAVLLAPGMRVHRDVSASSRYISCSSSSPTIPCSTRISLSRSTVSNAFDMSIPSMLMLHLQC